jgi:hypothetical protein
VTAYNDVRNLEDLDCKLQCRHEVKIVGIDEVRVQTQSAS